MANMRVVATVLLLLALVSGLKCAQQVLNVTFEHHEQLNLFKTNNPCHVAIITATWNTDCINTVNTQNSLRQTAMTNGWSIMNGDVGTREQWMQPSNYLVSDPLYRVQAVPSIFLIVNSRVNMSIVSQAVYNQTQIDSLTAQLNQGIPAICRSSFTSAE